MKKTKEQIYLWRKAQNPLIEQKLKSQNKHIKPLDLNLNKYNKIMVDLKLKLNLPFIFFAQLLNFYTNCKYYNQNIIQFYFQKLTLKY